MRPGYALVASLAIACLGSGGSVDAARPSLASAGSTSSDLTFATKDWTFRAPSELGSQADLELVARESQLCTDDVRTLIGHRPRLVAKFSMVWVAASVNVSQASGTGVTNFYTAGYRLIDDAARAFRESVVARGRCFGPHEITHVLTADSWGPLWANEGFATFTDRLYESATWTCCAAEPTFGFSCDATGYSLGPERHPYADLSPFALTTEAYHTAACFWLEVYARGGFSAIRRTLASARIDRPTTTGELVLHNANPAVAADLRPVARRYGFTEEELVASGSPLAPAPPSCVARETSDGEVIVGTIATDTLTGTAGKDFICGLEGNDRLDGKAGQDLVQGGPGDDRVVGSAGHDELRGGTGSDLLLARDRSRDLVLGGAGRDRARIDRGFDRTSSVETLLP
jgi:hypothetical protein